MEIKNEPNSMNMFVPYIAERVGWDQGANAQLVHLLQVRSDLNIMSC